MYDMSYYWSCEPEQLRWMGGTYARDPKNFPACQQETAWIYANLRPLRIQPPKELMRMRFARLWQHAPDWPAPRLTPLHEISVKACGAQLYKYMWHGYELPVTWFKRSSSNPSWRSRTKEDRKWGAYEQPPAAALDHPKTPSTAFGSRSAYPLLLPSAKRLQQMPHAECAATEHALEIKRRNEEGTGSDTSADSEDYCGTLT